MGDWPLLPVVLSAVLVFGGNWTFRLVSSGWTAVRAEKSIHRHLERLARAAGKENPR